MKRTVAEWSRWLHIYLSMFSFVIVLFFSVTGLTLNHLDWFPEKEVLNELDGRLNPAWVNATDTAKVKKLEIVEFLRASHQVKGQLNDFRIDESEFSISFQGPGYTADVFVDRTKGSYHLSERSLGVIAWANDLHKGRDTGQGWKWVIDFSAIFMTVISITGLILLLFIKKKRANGLLWLVLGIGAIALFYFI
ncbi:PepSY-associated TM helix domain-containing protein [Aquirufa sp.]|uniref:PepSY-associated TM helix domain-containing protein n=1 Tax=Aquirufa sp. TaxID=2676249 RepID=UPI0037C147EC